MQAIIVKTIKSVAVGFGLFWIAAMLVAQLQGLPEHYSWSALIAMIIIWAVSLYGIWIRKSL